MKIAPDPILLVIVKSIHEQPKKGTRQYTGIQRAELDLDTGLKALQA